MKLPGPLGAGDASEEIAALIATLHETGQRLEELTAGEVDTVADPEGRTFLLRGPQEKLRTIGAAKQEAILDALPAHIALLDTHGVIVAVNDAWRRFAAANALSGRADAVGVNYIDTCDLAIGKCSIEAHQVAIGIRAVLAGVEKVFSIEYPCHSRTEQRWFLLKVTPLAGSPPNGAVVMHIDVSLEKLAEERLRASESRFRQIAGHIRDVFFTVDAGSGRVLYVSDAYESIWGRSPESVLGKPWSDVIHPEDRASVFLENEAGEVVHEYRIARPDGSIRWIESRGFPVRDGDGRIVRIAGVARDVTEAREAARQLRESEARFRSLTALSSDWYWEQDAQFRFVEFSDGGQSDDDDKSWRKDLASAVGLRRWELPGLKLAGGNWDEHKALLEAHKPFRNFEYRRLRDNGTFQYASASGEPVFDAGGRFTGYRGVGADITHRKHADEALERFSKAMDATVDAIYLVDRASMSFVHVNDAACRMLGRTREELMALGPKGVLSTPIADLEQAYDLMIASGVPAEPLELPRTRRDGSQVWVELRRHAQRSAEGWTIVTLVRDITQRKRDDESLRRLRAAMDATADAIYMVDRSSMQYVYINETACRMQEKSREELMALGPDGVLGIPRAELEVAYDAMIESGVPAEPLEMLRGRKDGSSFWVELRRHAQRSENGWTIITLSRDITARKEQAEDLQRFRAAMEVSGDAIMLIDRASMRYIDVNQTLCDLVGRSRAELIGMTPMDIFSADRATLERDYDALIADEDGSRLVEGEYRHKNGSVIPVETRRRALRTEKGWVIVGTARDITERKAAEDKITYLNRVYAVLSGINTLIVRERNRDELFREACRIAVEEGGFRLAWVGLADREARQLVPVASVGDDVGLLPDLAKNFSLEESESVRSTLAIRALREQMPMISNDTQSDPKVALGGKHVEAGIRSMAMLPLVVSGEAVGVFGLYAGEIDFFHDEEVKLLAELAGDISFAIDHLAKQERLEYLAYYDVLTGLANRSLFLERVAQYMRAAAAGGRKFALFFIDLERFKNVNESLGRQAGDALLKQVAGLLTSGEGDPNLVARMGADHFAVVMPEIKDKDDVVRFLEDRIGRFQEHRFKLDDSVLRIAMKVGVAIFPDDATDAEILLRNAEAALKKAKSRGDRYLFYKQKMTDKRAGKLSLENKLRTALEKEEFVLHYQPKVSLVTGKLTSAEALIRWNDPEKGLVPPGLFIPNLEETGLIHEVGRWALRKGLEEYLRWRAAGLPAVRIAVNVSPLQLRDRGFVDEVEHAVCVDPLAAAGLELEITESLIMEDVKHSIASLQAIRDMLVTVAIDDFGTGFSSLSYLSKLPVDTLKIDRSFVVDMTTGPDGLALVSTIINLAHSFKLKVVAEGVETEEQKRLLRLLNCNEMQGYLFSKPVPAAEFEARFLAPATLPAKAA